MAIRFSKFDTLLTEARRESNAETEANIRSAHEDQTSRPVLSGIPEYIYEALVHANDEDQRAYEEEVAAQRRALEEP